MNTGDIVQWVKTTIKGSHINMHQYTGTLEAIDGIFRTLEGGYTA